MKVTHSSKAADSEEASVSTATISLLMWMGAEAMLTAPCSCISPQSAKWGPSYIHTA